MMADGPSYDTEDPCPAATTVASAGDAGAPGQSKRRSHKFLLHEPKSSQSHLKQPLLNPVDIEDESDDPQPWFSPQNGHSERPRSGTMMGSMSIAPVTNELSNKQGTIGHEEISSRRFPFWWCFCCF